MRTYPTPAASKCFKYNSGNDDKRLLKGALKKIDPGHYFVNEQQSISVKYFSVKICTKVCELACGSFIGSAGENLVLLDEVKSWTRWSQSSRRRAIITKAKKPSLLRLQGSILHTKHKLYKQQFQVFSGCKWHGCSFAVLSPAWSSMTLWRRSLWRLPLSPSSCRPFLCLKNAQKHRNCHISCLTS